MYSITTTLEPRYPCSCTALRYALFFWLLAPAAAWAEVDTRDADELIYSSRDTWFGYLKNNILTQYPQPGSEAANLDRLGSIDYTHATPDRLKLANADASQLTAYKLAIMTKAALGALTSSKSPSAAPDLKKIAAYTTLRSLYNSGTFALDVDTGKNRRADFILKDDFLRGRPKDVLDSASEYKKNYIMVTGSSFPSGHTWDGYEAANNLSLIFPERGSELISRALQYGESRIVLKMHFPTDTIASRAGNYYYLSTLLENDTLAKTFFELSKGIRAQVDASKLCPESLRNCLEAQASPLTDAQANENYSLGYYKQMLARPAVVLAPTQIPQQAGNLLRFRFPYLKSAEWRQILASTAYPSNSLAGWTFDAANPDANWGLINLPRAFAGPTYFYEDFTVTQNPETDLDLAGFSRIDTWKEAIAGPGALIKDGSGTLVLEGNNTFRGGTTVSAGTLVGTASSFGTGAITNNASLVLDQTTDATLANTISGTGTLTKTGSGALILNANARLDGGTQVRAGSLIVGGAAGSSAVLRGNLQVNGAALLGGHGQVIGNVTLANGATLSPGNSIGTLHINGDVQFGNGSNLNIEANPDGQADRLQANGIVSLAGSNLKVLAGNGDWSPSTRYQIVQAGSVTGRFSTLSSNLAFLSPLLTYSSQGIDLELQRNDIPFTSVSQSSNQSAVANALEPAATQELSKQVTNLSADQARAAFDSLSGELHASTRGVLFDDSRQVRESLGNRLRGTQGQSTKEGILHHDAGTGLSVWLGGYGCNSEKNGNHAIASVSHRNKGSLLGIDVPMGEYWRAGLVAGYGSSNLNLSGRDSSASIDSTTLGAYLGGQWDAWNLRLGLTHSWNKIDSKRGVNVGLLSERLKAGYDADTTQVFGELGYALQYGDLNLEPFVGLTHVEVASATLREHGGNSALTSDSERASINYAGLGVNINAPLAKVAGMPLNVRGSLAWQHALEQPDGSQRVSLSGYDSFAIKGAPIARDTVLAQLGVSLQLAPHVNLDLGYSGQAGSGTREHGAQLGLNVSF